MEIFGIPIQAFMGQLMLGLVNGAFYAMLSLGLAVIFGLLDIVNFAHGALYMLGAFAAWIMLDQWGVNYWAALLLAPLIVGIFGVIIERLFLKRLYGLDPQPVGPGRWRERCRNSAAGLAQPAAALPRTGCCGPAYRHLGRAAIASGAGAAPGHG